MKLTAHQIESMRRRAAERLAELVHEMEARVDAPPALLHMVADDALGLVDRFESIPHACEVHPAAPNGVWEQWADDVVELVEATADLIDRARLITTQKEAQA